MADSSEEPGDEEAEAEQVFLIGEADAGRRLDVLLAEKMPDVSRSQLQRLIATGAVQVGGAPAKASVKTQTGDLVLVQIPPTRPSHILPEAIPLDLIFEDDELIVVNKPQGMVVHPAPGATSGTLVNALLAHAQNGGGLSSVGGIERPGIVHRLDKDTTGLLVVAKTDRAHHSLQAQIQARTAVRRYLALVWGQPPFVEAIVEVAIGRHPTDRKRMTVVEPGSDIPARAAVTELTVRESLGPFTLLECKLRTGRTHQIRVHCAFAGFPVVGDPVYGGLRKVSAAYLRGAAAIQVSDRVAGLHGQALHAYHLSFDHPVSGKRLTFEAPPPGEMAELMDLVRALPGGGAG